MSGTRDRFFDLVAHGSSGLRGPEVLLASLVGEESDFVRLNHGLVRQPMTIRQAHLTLSLISGARCDTTTLSISGVLAEDRESVTRAIARMRDGLPELPEDPYLLYSTEAATSERVERGALAPRAEALDTVLSAARGTDLVGLYTAGPVRRGFASSLGHRHWHEVESYQLSFSLYHSADRAVQQSIAGGTFRPEEVRARVDAARRDLEHLALPPRRIPPGRYRAYLSPAALTEVVAMLSWGGVSAKAQRTRTSCLEHLVDGTAALSPLVTFSEHTAFGLAPAFDDVGFPRPARVELVREGKHAGALVSPRTSREYGIAANGADAEEGLHSADLAPGTLPMADVLAALDTGILVGNLWYLNFSDRANARLTGMTRFATFWVERGRIVAPLEVMRFDDTLFRMLGDDLEALTREREWMPSTNTYEHRSVDTTHLPGALLRGLALTL